MINQAQFDAIKAAVIEAGGILRQGWLNPSTIVHEIKADGSLVSNFDRMSEEWLLQKLPAIIPAIPLVSEEEDAAGIKKEYGSIYCTIDPLDGTRNYLAHKRSFVTLLAIVENGRTIAGVAYSPMHNIIISSLHGVCKIETVSENGALHPFTPPARDPKILRMAFNGRTAKDNAELNFFEKLRSQGYTISYDSNPEQYTRLFQAALGELDFYIAEGSAARSWDVAPFDELLRAQSGAFRSTNALDDAYATHSHFIAARDKKLMDLLLGS